MNAKELIENLKANYPEQQHPTEQAIKDLIRTMRTLNYPPDQIEKIYDILIRNCKYFPKTYDLIGAASHLNLPLRQKKPEKVFQTWADENGRPWAKAIGERFPESFADRDERYVREALSPAEGNEIYREAFAMAAEGFIAEGIAENPARLKPKIVKGDIEFEFMSLPQINDPFNEL